MTDWAAIKSIVVRADKVSALNKITYVGDLYSPTSVGDLYSPTSATNANKSATIYSSLKSSAATTLLTSSVTDDYDTKATIENVDQDGNAINGYPGVVPSVALVNGSYVVTGSFGQTGDPVLNTVPTIPGYVFTNTTGPTTYLADGSGVLVNHYQVSSAQLTSDYPGINDTASGDAAATTQPDTETGTDTISFTTTDADLAQVGIPYTVQVVNGSGAQSRMQLVTAPTPHWRLL